MAYAVLRVILERLRARGPPARRPRAAVPDRRRPADPGRARGAAAVCHAARSRVVAIRCVYTDLDGTLLGRGASLFRTAEGDFTLLAARALEACHRAGAEVVIKSGRRRAQVMEDARLMGQTLVHLRGRLGLVIDGEVTFLTGDLQPREGRDDPRPDRASRARRRCCSSATPGGSSRTRPGTSDREVSHLFRGQIDAARGQRAARRARATAGLRLVDNGRDRGTAARLPPDPRRASKAARSQRTCGRADTQPEECIAVGDSREDLDVAQVVGRFFLVANADVTDAAGFPGVERTEAAMSEGFYEAVVRALAESR